MPGSNPISGPKKALVIRYGAYGDAVVATPVLRLLKEDGYRVTLNCSEYSADVYKHNPNVDEFIVHITNSVPNVELDKHWTKLAEGYDKVINLSESVEKTLLKMEGHPDFKWSKEERHETCNVNYYDRTLELAGYAGCEGTLPELFFSREEEKWASLLRHQYKNRFLILWSLSGSSFHKVYHRADEVARGFLERHKDAVTFTVGGDLERLLEWDHPSNRKRCNQWPIRKSLIMTKYADLVVGTETGVLNASACYDTPKIVMLSHSSEENLTKHWKNCTSLYSNAPCYPCHQLHYTLESCPLESISEAPSVGYSSKEIKFRTKEKYPACMALLNPDKLRNAIEERYQEWRSKWQPLQPRQLQLS